MTDAPPPASLKLAPLWNFELYSKTFATIYGSGPALVSFALSQTSSVKDCSCLFGLAAMTDCTSCSRVSGCVESEHDGFGGDPQTGFQGSMFQMTARAGHSFVIAARNGHARWIATRQGRSCSRTTSALDYY